MSDRSGPIPKLHVVTDDRVLSGLDVADVAIAILTRFAGAVAVHIRGPRTASRKIYEIVDRVAAATTGVGLFVNDRVDVALACEAGVHLGARSLPVADARALLPEGTLVGRSIRGQAAEGAGSDFLFAGPVFETPSHPDLRGRGTAWAGTIAAQAAVPVLGIGGISADRIGVLLDAGVYGVAVIRSVWTAPDPLRAVDDLLKCLDDNQTT